MRESEKLKDKIVKWSMLTLVGVTFIGGMLFMWPTYLKSRALQEKDAELDLAIERKRAEIARLIEYQHRFRTDRDFVEMIARQPQNRRVFPGEIVFVFEDDETKK